MVTSAWWLGSSGRLGLFSLTLLAQSRAVAQAVTPAAQLAEHADVLLLDGLGGRFSETVDLIEDHLPPDCPDGVRGNPVLAIEGAGPLVAAEAALIADQWDLETRDMVPNSSNSTLQFRNAPAVLVAYRRHPSAAGLSRGRNTRKRSDRHGGAAAGSYRRCCRGDLNPASAPTCGRPRPHLVSAGQVSAPVLPCRIYWCADSVGDWILVAGSVCLLGIPSCIWKRRALSRRSCSTRCLCGPMRRGQPTGGSGRIGWSASLAVGPGQNPMTRSSSRTASADFCSAAPSSSPRSNSTIRSTPPDPSTTGTPRYTSRCPYSPER